MEKNKRKVSKGQEKYIIKIANLAKQEEKVRILNIIEGQIKKEKDCDNKDRYEEQHFEHQLRTEAYEIIIKLIKKKK